MNSSTAKYTAKGVASVAVCGLGALVVWKGMSTVALFLVVVGLGCIWYEE